MYTLHFIVSGPQISHAAMCLLILRRCGRIPARRESIRRLIDSFIPSVPGPRRLQARRHMLREMQLHLRQLAHATDSAVVLGGLPCTAGRMR